MEASSNCAGRCPKTRSAAIRGSLLTSRHHRAPTFSGHSLADIGARASAWAGISRTRRRSWRQGRLAPGDLPLRGGPDSLDHAGSGESSAATRRSRRWSPARARGVDLPFTSVVHRR